MSELCSAELHRFMSRGGRELQNLKFIAGSSPTVEGVCKELTRVIKSAIDCGMPHNPPHTGLAKTRL